MSGIVEAQLLLALIWPISVVFALITEDSTLTGTFKKILTKYSQNNFSLRLPVQNLLLFLNKILTILAKTLKMKMRNLTYAVLSSENASLISSDWEKNTRKFGIPF